MVLNVARLGSRPLLTMKFSQSNATEVLALTQHALIRMLNAKTSGLHINLGIKCNKLSAIAIFCCLQNPYNITLNVIFEGRGPLWIISLNTFHTLP
ncbi:hypothetical protein VIGAN_01269500 [Vigna angularis var. angularis]|uniref:Uncharacterized protein n=1 Tax=Vigna angularis var. angularis TaxID=157739 RepID=A0A0S3R2T4_PHAAN|nr:hypothetical protein VIGAN_01269500 [Vigna angularis var. angularis]